MAYDEIWLYRISDSTLWLILLSQLRNMNHSHQIICVCRICIKTGTHQDLLNHWFRWQLRYIYKHANSITGVSVEQLNADIIYSKYGHDVIPHVEQIHPSAKDTAFSSMCDFLDKDIELQKCSCPGVFFPGAEMKCEEDVNLPLIFLITTKIIALVICNNRYFLSM